MCEGKLLKLCLWQCKWIWSLIMIAAGNFFSKTSTFLQAVEELPENI